jgi:hypothetical protein
MMILAINRRLPCVLVCAILATGTTPASAQGYGPSPPLGGYGASSGDGMRGMTIMSPMIIPYGGTYEGFMPGRMGGGSALSLRSRPTTERSPRSAFRLSPLSGGMSAMPGGLRGPRVGSRDAIGPGGMRRMSRGGGNGVMPPRIGYPFRQPPSLVSPSSSGMGMAM